MSMSKPRNGKTSTQDYMNLIYDTDTESDNVPDLTLPPLKGKKPTKTKRRSTPRSSSAVSVKSAYSICSVVKVFTGILLIASVVALSITTFWLMQQVRQLKEQISACHAQSCSEHLKNCTNSSCCFTCYTLTCILLLTLCLLASATLVWMHLQLKRDFNDLRDRLELVESKNAHTPEGFQNLQSKLTSMNKSLNDMKTGKTGLDVLNQRIVTMKTQIASLFTTTTELQNNMQTSDSSDKDHKDVKTTVADLGSELQTMKSEADVLKVSQRSYAAQIANLTNRVAVLENPGGREGGSSVPDLQNVQVLLSQINATFTQAIYTAMNNLTNQQTHIEALGQFTQNLQDQVTHLNQLIVNLNQSQQTLQEKANRGTATGSDGAQSSATAQITQLTDKVDQLQNSMEQLQSDHNNLTNAEPDASSDMDIQTVRKDHEDFRREVYQDISSLNASIAFVNGTVVVLKHNVEELSAKMSTVQASITSISEEVSSITHTQQKSESDVTGTGLESTKSPGSVGSSTSPAHNAGDQANSSDNQN